MHPVKRQAHKNAAVTNLLKIKRMKIEQLKEQSVPTQTEVPKKKPNNYGQSCQTQKAGPKIATPLMPMDSVMQAMSKQRKLSIDKDRAVLKRLMGQINASPPPSWHVASLMWLDVDVLERRIEDFEKEQAENKDPAKKDKPEK